VANSAVASRRPFLNTDPMRSYLLGSGEPWLLAFLPRHLHLVPRDGHVLHLRQPLPVRPLQRGVQVSAWFFLLPRYADSMLTQDNMKEPEVEFCLCRELHPENKLANTISNQHLLGHQISSYVHTMYVMIQKASVSSPLYRHSNREPDTTCRHGQGDQGSMLWTQF
jgi:hypothetical protein